MHIDSFLAMVFRKIEQADSGYNARLRDHAFTDMAALEKVRGRMTGLSEARKIIEETYAEVTGSKEGISFNSTGRVVDDGGDGKY